MKTKHTSGPWTINTFNQLDYIDVVSKEDLIASIYIGNQKNFKYCQKNAELISEAPELLKTLIELFSIVEVLINNNHPLHKKTLTLIKKLT